MPLDLCLLLKDEGYLPAVAEVISRSGIFDGVARLRQVSPSDGDKLTEEITDIVTARRQTMHGSATLGDHTCPVGLLTQGVHGSRMFMCQSAVARITRAYGFLPWMVLLRWSFFFVIPFFRCS
ncbi:MAG: hypothetical protein GDA53_04635 [Rhodobacteraceae bacterium]|nr:hypothetical protein [Paracoccaceae bacterium]